MRLLRLNLKANSYFLKLPTNIFVCKSNWGHKFHDILLNPRCALKIYEFANFIRTDQSIVQITPNKFCDSSLNDRRAKHFAANKLRHTNTHICRQTRVNTRARCCGMHFYEGNLQKACNVESCKEAKYYDNLIKIFYENRQVQEVSPRRPIYDLHLSFFTFYVGFFLLFPMR